MPGDSLHVDDEARAALSAEPKIVVEYHRPLRAILGGDTVTGVRVGTEAGEVVVPADGAFIYLPGNAPVLDFIGDELERTEQGCIHVRLDRSTSLPGVFAAGDVLCSYLQQVVVAAADGAIAALSAEKYVRGRAKIRFDWSEGR